MEAIEVTAHFDAQGNITPLHFSWQGGAYQVESTGRHWQDMDGWHTLVMVAGDKMYELIFRKNEGRWFIKQPGPKPMFV
jgi:hypothetical protein